MSMQKYLPLFLLATTLTPAGASVAWKPIYGARGMGMGGATAAIALDSTATIVNPALLTEQKETRADLGALTFYRPGEITYTRDADELSPGGYPEQTQTTTTSTIPYGGFVWQPGNDKFAVGLGLNVPFVRYPDLVKRPRPLLRHRDDLQLSLRDPGHRLPGHGQTLRRRRYQRREVRRNDPDQTRFRQHTPASPKSRVSTETPNSKETEPGSPTTPESSFTSTRSSRSDSPT